jgi:uncharacterized membrane protein
MRAFCVVDLLVGSVVVVFVFVVVVVGPTCGFLVIPSTSPFCHQHHGATYYSTPILGAVHLCYNWVISTQHHHRAPATNFWAAHPANKIRKEGPTRRRIHWMGP